MCLLLRLFVCERVDWGSECYDSIPSAAAARRPHSNGDGRAAFEHSIKGHRAKQRDAIRGYLETDSTASGTTVGAQITAEIMVPGPCSSQKCGQQNTRDPRPQFESQHAAHGVGCMGPGLFSKVGARLAIWRTRPARRSAMASSAQEGWPRWVGLD